LRADYNGYMAGASAPALIQRLAPRQPGQPPPPARNFHMPSEATAAIGTDAQSVVLDYDAFVNLHAADIEDITRVYDPAGIDFRIRPDGPAADAGTPLPNVTDGFVGRAPDLGAYEAGTAPPHYGVRP